MKVGPEEYQGLFIDYDINKFDYIDSLLKSLSINSLFFKYKFLTIKLFLQIILPLPKINLKFKQLTLTIIFNYKKLNNGSFAPQ